MLILEQSHQYYYCDATIFLMTRRMPYIVIILVTNTTPSFPSLIVFFLNYRKFIFFKSFFVKRT